MPNTNHLVGLIEIDKPFDLAFLVRCGGDPATGKTTSPISTRQRLLGEAKQTGTRIVGADLQHLTADLQRELDELLNRILTARMRDRFSTTL